MLAEDMRKALDDLEKADHAVTVQKDWLRRAEKYQRECQVAVDNLAKTPFAPPAEPEGLTSHLVK